MSSDVEPAVRCGARLAPAGKYTDYLPQICDEYWWYTFRNKKLSQNCLSKITIQASLKKPSKLSG
jgi:hypothetical protein